LRDRAIAALCEGAYRAVFSSASLVAIVWLVAYKDALYGIPEWWKPIAIILMLPAFLLAVIGLITPNPTFVGQEGRVARSPEGIVGYTPSIPHWYRIVGGGASGRQRRCRNERGSVFIPVRLASSEARARQGGIQLVFQHRPDEAAHTIA
jgi:NnrU protein